MPDIKHLLSEEIRRLAKKEVKLAVAPLQKTISEQKKTIQMLLRKMGQTEKSVSAAVPEAVAPACECENKMPADGKLPRLNAKRITRLRLKLGLSKKDFAAVVGVTQFTVINWETGRCAPRDLQKKRLTELLTMGKRAFVKMLNESFPAVKVKSAGRKTRVKKAAKAVPAE